MLKFVNPGQNAIGDMVEGYLEFWSKRYRRIGIDRGNYYGIMCREISHPVSVVVGGGSGNDPWCIGYVGEGLADAAVIGPIYTAPSARAIQTVTRSVPNRDGVVYICANHAGDVLNFELASELAELEGIPTRTVAVTDDISSASIEEKNQRRGTAGVLFVVKSAGGAAALGMNMEDVARIAEKANDNTYTFSAITSSFYDPETGNELLSLEEGMVEYGSGFSGENGLFRKPFVSANDTVDTVVKYLLSEIRPLPMDEVAVMVNGFGQTSNMELSIIARRALYDLRLNEINVCHSLGGHVYSPMESSGFSLSIMCMDEELRHCFEQPAWSPMLPGFTEKDMDLGVHYF